MRPVHVRRHVRRRTGPPVPGRSVAAPTLTSRPDVAASIERIRSLARGDHEVAIGTRADGTSTVIEGGERHVELDEPGYVYTFHTHPGESPPSVKDVLSLWARKSQRESYIVTKRNAWAIRKTQAVSTDSAHVFDLYRQYRELEREILPWQEGGYARGFAEAIGMEFGRVRP